MREQWWQEYRGADDEDNDGTDLDRAMEHACGMTNNISGAATPPLNTATAQSSGRNAH
jgi:hypothetical protein